MKRKILSLLILIILGTLGITAKTVFTGTIGNKYRVTVVFDQDLNYVDRTVKVTGSYWYGSGKNGKIKLKGTLDYLGRIDLDEYDPQGKKTGYWFVILCDGGHNNFGLSGIMTNKDDRVFNVDCSEVK